MKKKKFIKFRINDPDLHGYRIYQVWHYDGLLTSFESGPQSLVLYQREIIYSWYLRERKFAEIKAPIV